MQWNLTEKNKKRLSFLWTGVKSLFVGLIACAILGAVVKLSVLAFIWGYNRF
jgi:hypothetical protein